MKDINVITGFGIIKNVAGDVEMKMELPPGLHSINDEFTYEEVADRAALDAVALVQVLSPADQAAQAAFDARSARQASARSSLKALNGNPPMAVILPILQDLLDDA